MKTLWTVFLFFFACWPAQAAGKYDALRTARVTEIAAMLAAAPQGFGPDYHDRAAFEALKAKPAFAGIIPSAEKLLTQDFPAWNDALYLDFSRTGRRPAGEKMLGDRQAWLRTLVWAECLEDRGRFVPEVNMVLHELASQKSWTLPAHDTSLSSFRGTSYFVELNSAGLAHDLAQSLYMLGDKVTPDVRREVMLALTQRVFDPVRASLQTGKGHWWLTSTNNWNAVCLAGVTGAALTILPDRDDRAVFAAAAEHYSRYYVNGFSADGYCNEGLGYYNYGFGNFLVLRETLWQATQGKLDLFADPKIKAMALYGPHIEIINGVAPAIGDCRFGTQVDPQILWYCSRVLGLGLTHYDMLDFVKPGTPARAAMLSFPNSASQARPSGNTAPGAGLRSYFNDAGVLICRPAPGGRLGVALAGGNNGKSHNHNDVGSFTVALGSEIPVGDPGGPYAYTADTFGPRRYTEFQMFRSRTHPVPLVAGHEQKPGRAAAAKILKTDFTNDSDQLVMDIASAYDAPELTKLVRSFTYSRAGDGSLAVRDDFAFTTPQTFEISLTTHGKWTQIAPDTLDFQSGAETLRATIQAPGAWTVTAETIEENAPPFTRLGLKLNAPLQAGTVTVTFRPAPTAGPTSRR